MRKSEKIKVSVFIATSLDGYIARPDGDVSWLEDVDPFGEGDDGGFGQFFGSVDVLVMGRGTFEKVLEFDPWPYGTKPVIVLSKSLTEIPEKLRDRVRIDASKKVYLDGGMVIQSFLREGLVDDMVLTVIPVLIGEGVPLFGDLEKDIKLRLLETRSWENGVVQSKYQVLR
jgi:dihydrofolate reductase